MAAGLADHVWSLSEWLTLPAVHQLAGFTRMSRCLEDFHDTWGEPGVVRIPRPLFDRLRNEVCYAHGSA